VTIQLPSASYPVLGI